MGGTTTLPTLLGGGGGVTLDRSTLQSIGSGGSGPVTLDKKTLQPINPTDEQKFSRTLQNMTYAMSGQSDQMHPDDKAEFDRGVKAGTASAIATAATVGVEGAAAPLTAPRVAGTTAVGTGILDATGREIMRDVTTYGPSVARQIFSHPLTQSLLARAAGYAGAGYILKALGLFGGK
jgi:hypothetical protein